MKRLFYCAEAKGQGDTAGVFLAPEAPHPPPQASGRVWACSVGHRRHSVGWKHVSNIPVEAVNTVPPNIFAASCPPTDSISVTVAMTAVMRSSWTFFPFQSKRQNPAR